MGFTGKHYSQELIASGGTQPYIFSLFADSLPPGLTLNPTGVLEGFPTVDGVYSFTLQATDSSFPLSGSQTFTIEIVELNKLFLSVICK